LNLSRQSKFNQKIHPENRQNFTKTLIPAYYMKWMMLLSLLSTLGIGGEIAQNIPYRAIPLINGKAEDTLTDRDIPTGQKGFARDYKIEVQADDRLEISASSTAFDTVVSLLTKDGNAIAENDDGAVGTDSLLFVKIIKSGSYTVRVQSFGGSSGGKFRLTVTRLRPVPFSP
jgi:hypothetical protein